MSCEEAFSAGLSCRFVEQELMTPAMDAEALKEHDQVRAMAFKLQSSAE